MLDGGLQAWQASGGAVQSGPQAKTISANYVLALERITLATIKTVASRLGRSVDDQAQTLMDARAAPRYRGEVEPLDPVAGHIPGALNRPFAQNIGADGRFKPADQLKAEFLALLGGHDPASVVHHCGSSVSAAPNILAMEVAGLGRTVLFAGSWSEWCNTPGAPIAQG